MQYYLMALGYEVCESMVTGSTVIDESKEYNTKSMKAILSSLSDSVKGNISQCSSAKSFMQRNLPL